MANLQRLYPGNDLYDRVTGRMQETIVSDDTMSDPLSSFKFKQVFLIKNDVLRQAFERKRASLERALGTNSEVWEAFHGSPAAEEIANNGFDLRFAYDELKFGKGVYMTPYSSKANHYTYVSTGIYREDRMGCPNHDDEDCKQCTRCILLCKCIMGNKYTPSGPISTIPSGYDSLVANPVENRSLASTVQYTEYVIRHEDQVLPYVLIQYTI